MIFVDMDGVLAKWNPEASIEDTYTDGYFLQRVAEGKIIKLIRLLMKMGEKVAILSAVYPTGSAGPDKHKWLDRIGLPDIRRIFVPYGEDKHNFIPELKEPMILLDDYSKNLHAWREAGHVGIKFYNGVNGTHGTWDGPSINRDMTVEEMFGIIVAQAYERK